MELTCNIGGAGTSFNVTPSTGDWHHAGFSYSNGTLTLYYDGQKVNESSVASEDMSSRKMLFGAYEISNTVWNTNGNLDDVRVYNRALSEPEINALYQMRSSRVNSTDSPHRGNLLLHLNARRKDSVDQSNKEWYDISGNGHTAYGTSGNGDRNDSLFPDWEANNGGRFILNGFGGWNVAGPIETSGQVSLESWFYRSDLSSGVGYLSDARNGSGGWHLTNYRGYNINFQNRLRLNDPAGGDYSNSGATSTPSSNLFDRWTHLVATSDGSISQIFIDGDKITDNRLQIDYSFPTGIGSDFAIANRYSGQNHLQGYMSVYRIYDTVLSPQQVKTNYESEKKYYR